MDTNTVIEQVNSSKIMKIILILTAVILPHLALKILGIDIDINPLVLTGVLFTGFIFFVYTLGKSLKHPIIPYLLLQLTLVWILLGKKILAPVGLDFKPHSVVFIIAVLTSVYFIILKFKDLWEYKPFRYLFIFFLVSTTYAFFYKTDFRSSSYIDLWIQNNLGLKFNAIQAGAGAISREFGSSETKFLVYLSGLIPLVSFVTGFFALRGNGSFISLKQRLYQVIGLFSSGVLAHYLFLTISVLIGSSTIMFVDGRLAIDGGFVGGDYTAVFLMIMVSFYYFVTGNFKNYKFYNPIKSIITANIVILSSLILLGIKKGTMISLAIAVIVAFIVVFAVKSKTGQNFLSKDSVDESVAEKKGFIKPVMFFVVAFVCMAVLLGTGIAEELAYKITDRFASSDTLDIRVINWQMYISNWMNNLDLQKLIFGFGIDSSRETTFFLTAMHPNPSYQQPHIHNVYLEMFYNYGLMAIFYFMPFIYIARASFRDALYGVKELDIKIFNVLAISIVTFYFVFDMAESPSMTGLIVNFSLLGFLESTRNALGHKSKILLEGE